MTKPESHALTPQARSIPAATARRNARRPKGSPRRCPAFDHLEERVCLSVFYDYDVMARTNSGGIGSSISPAVSINDSGKVAFVAASGAGQDIFVGDSPGVMAGITDLVSPSRTYGQEIQINNAGQVAAVAIDGGPTVGRFARIYAGTAGGGYTTVGRAISPRNSLLQPQYFDSIGAFTSLSNDGQLAFAGFESDSPLPPSPSSWEIHLADGSPLAVDRRDALNTEDSEVTTLPSAPTFFRFMAADGDRVIIGSRDSSTGPYQIVWYDITGTDTSETIASTATGWTKLGVRPGISDDGSIVVFYGDDGSTQGIFASIRTPSGRRLVEVASDADFDGFDPDVKVSVNATNHAEAFADANGNGVFDAGESFTDSNKNGQYDPDQRAVTVVYSATRAGVRGIYSTRLNFFGDAKSYDPDNPKTIVASRPTPVVQIGDTITGLGTVTDLSLNDAVSNHDRGEVAFWAAAGSTQGVVRARPQQVVYLDFDPVSHFAADPGFGLDLFAKDVKLPPAWPGDLDSVFSSLAPSRADLNGSANVQAIEAAIAGAVQAAFANVGASVRVLDSISTPVAPQGDRFTRVFIGDGPHGGSQPDSGLDGIAASIDLFNQDIFQSGTTVKLFGQDTVLVFADNTFRLSSGKFVDPAGSAVSLDAGPATPGYIPAGQVVDAVADVIAHEVGHSLGLAHLINSRNDLLMNSNTDPQELRSAQIFGTSPVLRQGSTDGQDDELRLAFAAGSDDRTLVRTPPSPALIGSLSRDKFKIGALMGSGPVTVAAAFLGIIPSGEDDLAPELIDLGSGDLASLLDREIEAGAGDRVFLVASTDGTKPDIVSVSPGYAGDLSSIGRSNSLLTLVDARIRGNLFDDAGNPAVTSFNLARFTPTGPVVIGSVGSPVSTNRPPVLDPIGSKTVDESDLLSFTAAATDPDPGQTLSFSLDPGAPAGAAIDPSTGAFTWTPTEAQGPGKYTFTVRVTDDGSPALFDEEQITVTVNEVNVAPVLAGVPAAATIGEEMAYHFTATASDADLPANSLTFSLIGAPAGAAIDPSTGAFTWTPTEAQGPGNYTFTVRVTDDGSPILSDEAPITISVNEVNRPPVLTPIGNQSVEELTTLSFTLAATDPDLPADALTYSATGLPAGATFDPATRSFTWTPTEAQGPGTSDVTFTVSDGSLSASETIRIIVTEVNAAPVLAGVPASATVDVLATLSFTATASDPDLPANGLTYVLIGAPAGASIDPNTGVFSWTPTQAQGPASYTFAVRVTDDGSPALFDEKPITVTVPPAESVVAIDIKPGDADNTINPKSRGNIPVALFGSATFDVTQVDLSSLTFGRTGDEHSLIVKDNGTYQASFEDIDGDGYLDLVLHFDTRLAGFQAGDTAGILKGRLRNGRTFRGQDSVRTLG